MSVNLSPVGGAGAQFCDNNGNPLNGGKLYTYSAGTTTPAATYTSVTGGVFHPNPIVLNAGGRVPDSGEIWLSDNISYKFVLKTSADVLIATWDNINGINSNFVNYTIQEEVITATAGQTVFNLSTITYAPGTNSLAVFVDGVNQIVTDAYLETDANTVTFVSGLHVGALVKFTTAVPATGTSTDASVVAYTPQVGGVTTNVGAKLDRYISVLDFGADPTGATDSTAAFQAALDAAKGTDATGAGRTVFSLYVPSYPNGFYKISDTLVIDGTHGLKIFGDGAYTKRNRYPTTDNSHTIRWYGTRKPIFQVQGQTGIPSNPDFMIKIQDLTICGYPTGLDPTTSVPANCALSGIHFGNIDGYNDNTLVRHAIIENVQISDCRFGIWGGNPDGLNTDHASVMITDCYISNNAQTGIHWGTGNAIAEVYGCHIVNNGWGATQFPADDYSTQHGANVHLQSGYINLTSITTAGTGDYQPYTADIYQASGRASVINAWSDTHGLFFKQASASQIAGVGYQIAQITGVRHWEGSMTALDTPDSIEITAPGTVVMGCSFYGNVRLTSGLSGRPVIGGIQFGRTDATFVGTGVDTQRSLLLLGSAGNYAQITMGGVNSGVALTKAGNNPNPNLLFANTTTSLMELIPASASGTGFHWYARADDANGAHELYFNCYLDNTAGGYVPFQNTKLCFKLTLGGTSGFRTYVADPAGSSGVLTWVDAGGVLSANYSGLRDEVAWKFPQRASNPSFTSGDWWEGAVYYNTTTNKLRVNTGGSTWVDLH